MRVYLPEVVANLCIGAAGSVTAGSLGNGNREQRPSIIALDPNTNKTTTLLNNYYGWYFNNIDDMDVDSRGDIWFTDPSKLQVPATQQQY
jgi:sugar lactone lactonase YvrE